MSVAQKPPGGTADYVHPDDFLVEDGEPDFRESLQADAQTLANRGFASNFCAAWLAFWRWALVEHGERLEEAYRLTFLDKKPMPAAKIVAGCARSTMALISAAVRADKFKSQRRRFKCSAWALESYRAGVELTSDALPAEARKRQRQNLARYWRARWRLLHLFMCVTQLPLFPREAKDWRANREARDAAAYTDQASELLFEVMGRGGRRRGLSRVRVFELAVEGAVENFRRRFGAYAPDFELPAPAAGAPASAPPAETKPAKVVSFEKAKEKLLAGVEAVRARAAAGALTPEEADEIVLLLAPLVGLTAGETSAKEDAVTLADAAENPPAKSTPISGGPDLDFAGKFEGPGAPPADIFIRREGQDFDPSSVTLDGFLEAFRPDPSEPLHLRAFRPRGAPDEPRFAPRKIPANRLALAEGGGLARLLRSVNRTNGIYFVVNQGGDSDAEIDRVTAFFAEADRGTLDEQHARLDACPLPPSARVETRKSVHAYWLAAPGCSVEEWREVQRRLIDYFGADPKIKNPSRVMRLPHFDHITYTGGLLDYKPVRVAAFDPSRRFTAGRMLAAFPAAAERRGPPRHLDVRRAGPGDLEGLKRELGARIMAHESARRNGTGRWDCRGVCHNGRGSTGLFYDPGTNFVWCNAQTPCGLAEIARAFGLEMPAGTPAAPAPHVRPRGRI